MDEQNNFPNVDPKDFKETDAYMETQVPGDRSLEAEVNEPAPQGDQSDTEILERMSQKGYDVSQYGSDQEFISDTEAKYSQNAIDYAQAGYEQQRYLEQRATAGPDPDLAAQQKSEGGNVPEFDPAWANLVEDDGNGRYVVRPEYIGSVDPSIADRVNHYVDFRQQRSNQLIDDPVGAVMEAGLQDEIERRIDQRVNSALTQNQMRNQAEEFVNTNQDILYVKDEKTGSVKKGRDGQPVLSAVGHALNNAHVMLRNNGMYDPYQRHAVALQMVQNHFTQQQMQQPMQQQMQQPMQSQNDSFKEQYTDQPFSEPTNPMPPGYMPNTPIDLQANAIGAPGMPEHTSLGSLATALAVHKGYLQPK